MEPSINNRPTEHEVNLLDWLPIGREVNMISRETCQPPKKQRTGEKTSRVSFLDEDLVEVHNPNNEPIIVSMTIAKHPAKCILVDTKSYADVLLYDAFVRMNLSVKMLRPISTPLVTFNGGR